MIKGDIKRIYFGFLYKMNKDKQILNPNLPGYSVRINTGITMSSFGLQFIIKKKGIVII